MKSILLISTGLALVVPLSAHAQTEAAFTASKSAVQTYDLSERCGLRAEKFFKDQFGREGASHDANGSYITNFRSHFNEHLNKCFILVSTDMYPTDRKERPNTQISLADVNENRTYGEFFAYVQTQPTLTYRVMECRVRDEKCASKQDFDAATDALMNQ